MRALLSSPLGFLIGLTLGALGSGGSIVAVPILVHVAGQAPSAATTTSLLVVGAAASTGMIGHARAGRVKLRTGTILGLTGIGGSLGGSAVNRSIDGDLLLLGFGLLMMVAAWRMVRGCPSCTRVGELRAIDDFRSMEPGSGGLGLRVRPQLDVATVVRVVAVGTAVGFLTGLFGVGGGFVIVPALALILGFTMPEAVGTSLLVVAVNAATALVVRLSTTGVEWSVALPFTLAALGGALMGNRLADRVATGSLVRWFAGSLVALSLYTMGAALSSLNQ